ncbi:MAG: hypothetical protein ACLFQV_04590 [Vulcanimicrobiota bacterium]
MLQQLAASMLGWFTMVLIMGYFIHQELTVTELELEEDDEPPSSRLAVLWAR